MAWTYHDFEDSATYTTAAARLARLRLHIGEVRGQIAVDVSADGKSRSSQGLIQYLKMLTDRLTELEGAPGNLLAGGLTKIRRGKYA